MPEHHAAYIEFSDTTSTILPLVVNLLTPRHIPFQEAELGMANTYKVAWPWHASTHSHRPHDEEPETAEGIDPDDEQCEENNGLQQIFQGMPLLNVYDAMLLVPLPERASEAMIDSTDPSEFLPRVFATTWLWKHSLKFGERVIPPYFGISYERWRPVGRAHEKHDRVTSSEAITQKVTRKKSRIAWTDDALKPTEPWEPVHYTDFRCMPASQELAQYQVDDYEPCELFHECIQRISNPVARLCELYSQRFEALIDTGDAPSARSILPQQDHLEIVWTAKERPEALRERLRCLRDYPPEKVWFVDFEGFCVAPGHASPVPLRIGIVNGVGKSDTGPTRYPFDDTSTMAEDIDDGSFLPPWANLGRIKNVLRRHYNG